MLRLIAILCFATAVAVDAYPPRPTPKPFTSVCTIDTLERSECSGWSRDANACEWDELVIFACPCSCEEWRWRKQYPDGHPLGNHVLHENVALPTIPGWEVRRGCLYGSAAKIEHVVEADSLQACINQCEALLSDQCSSVDFRQETRYCEFNDHEIIDSKDFSWDCPSGTILASHIKRNQLDGDYTIVGGREEEGYNPSNSRRCRDEAQYPNSAYYLRYCRTNNPYYPNPGNDGADSDSDSDPSDSVEYDILGL